MSLVEGLLDDLAAESADLDARVAALPGWSVATPAEGWDVHDTITHLCATDLDAVQAMTDPEAFRARVATVTPEYVDLVVEQGRARPRDELLDAWRTGRQQLADAVRALPAGTRVPWFGPPMSAASFVTARLMETWAHGQDVVDALDQERTPTARLRSVAEIGVRARAFSYAVHGRPLPEAPVRVELAAPDGGTWTWGPDDAADVVRAPALDFCLLVTQRRHRADLSLEADGPLAQEWLAIAQAFAGPPGGGRDPQDAS